MAFQAVSAFVPSYVSLILLSLANRQQFPSNNSDQAMTTPASTASYFHTQRAPLCLILYASALASFAIVLSIGEPEGLMIGGGAGLLIGLLAPCFHHLTVEDAGDELAIRFGPIPLFHRMVRYSDMASVDVGRTLILDGWGIHLSVRGGWVWNLWGRTCVVVHFKNGGTLRIGTDDAENLVRFLSEAIG